MVLRITEGVKIKFFIILAGCLVNFSFIADVMAGAAAVAPLAPSASVAPAATVSTNTAIAPSAPTAPVGSSPIAPAAQAAPVASIAPPANPAPAAPASVPPNATNAVMPYYLNTNTMHWLTNPPNGNPAIGYTNHLIFKNSLTNNATHSSAINSQPSTKSK